MLRVLGWQFGAAVAMAAVLWGLMGNVHGYSSLLGGMIAAIPNTFLALRLDWQ